ncbi:MAG: HEAT repeat domain-containing protein [Clostridiaceae bacterium]
MLQKLLVGVNIALGVLLLVGLILLVLLHITRAVDNRRVQKLREQLLCLISGAAEAKRMKNHIYEMVNPEGKLDQLSDIRGIRSPRGLIVMAETAEELSGAALEKLQKEAGGEWYGAYLRKLLDGVDEEATALVVKLIGALRLKSYTPDVVTQIYCCRTTMQMQHVGMLTLCMLGSERDIVALCRDHTIASLLSFRTLEEIFSVYTGDLKKLCRKLITSASDPYIRRTCIKAIGEQGYDDLGDLVLPHLTQGHINTRIDSARTLGQIRCESAIPQLIASASDPRWEMRAVVATALGAFSEQDNDAALLKLLCDREWWVRYRAAESLTKALDTKALMTRVEKTGDKFAAEMMRFALDRAALLKGGVA